MLFIAGTRGETTTVATGTFYCPECNAYTQYHHDQVYETVTVFFVPVAKVELLGEYIECQSCANTYTMEVLDYDPEQEQEELQAFYLMAIKKVMTTMMLADGKIDENERSIMKDIYHKLAASTLSDRDIDQEIKRCMAKPMEVGKCLRELGSCLNEAGRETVTKAAYWVSIADGEVDKREAKALKQAAKQLQISSAHLKGIISEVNELASG